MKLHFEHMITLHAASRFKKTAQAAESMAFFKKQKQTNKQTKTNKRLKQDRRYVSVVRHLQSGHFLAGSLLRRAALHRGFEQIDRLTAPLQNLVQLAALVWKESFLAKNFM